MEAIRTRSVVDLRPALLAAFLAAATVVAYLLVAPAYSDWGAYLLLLTLITLIPGVLMKARQGDFLSTLLLAPVLLFSLDAFMLRLGWLNTLIVLDQSWHPKLTEAAVRKAAGLALIGNLALWSGYFLPIGQRIGTAWIKRLLSHLHNDRLAVDPIRLWAAFGLGIAVRLYLIKSGIGGYFSTASLRQQSLPYLQLLLLIEGLSLLALVTTAASFWSGNRSLRIAFAIMLVVEIGSVLLMGFKQMVVYRCFYLSVVYAFIHRRFPWKMAALGVLSLIILFPVNMALRHSFGKGQFSAGDVRGLQSELASLATTTWGAGTVAATMGASVEQIVRNSAYLEVLALVTQHVDSTGEFFNGRNYLAPLFVFIPRALWPDKPVLSLGNWVYREVYGYVGETSVGQTIPGDLYMNFAVAGVLVGLALFGIVGRAVTCLIAAMRSPRCVPLIPYLVYAVGQPNHDLAAHVAGSVRLLLFTILALQFLVPGPPLRRRMPTATKGSGSTV